MTDYGHPLQFGVFVTPAAANAAGVVELALLAEAVGLDLVTFQDHPYQHRYLDTWTLLSVVAARASRIRLAPNVASLPLRPPAVLAKSVATLDILSEGRVDLGLGAGAFWDGIASLDGPRRTPGESVDALAEAVDAIRAFWDTSHSSVRLEGEHYRYKGARTGPAPLHRVEIWLGAYKPRMLALTGRTADGWLPSSTYAAPETLGPLTARIDAAAERAGRPPEAIRRLYNLAGNFGHGAGFLEGSPADWAQQLAALTLSDGMSVFLLAADDAATIERFAAEVAPAVRDLVERERLGAAAPAEPAPPPVPRGAERSAFAVRPTPDDGSRLSDERPWDDGTRPAGPAPDPERGYTPMQQSRGQHLIDVHDHLRGEMASVRDVIGQVARGQLDPDAARSLINRMTIRQNNWTLGTFCESYCRTVTTHHTIEDTGMFPYLRGRDEGLVPVIDRLEAEHHVIAELLDRVDERLVDLVAGGGDALDGLRRAVDLLADAMASHLSYEERELVEPLARLGFGPG